MNIRRMLLTLVLIGLTPGWTLQAESSESSPLTVSLSASPDPVEPGAMLTWLARVVNDDARERTAYDARIHDSLPDDVRLVRVESESALCAQNRERITCDAGDMPLGAEVTLRIEVEVLAQTGSEISNTITATSFSGRPRIATASGATAVTHVGAPPPEPVVIAPKTITLSPTCVEPGGSLTLASQGLDELELQQGDVVIGEHDAPILAISDTGLVVEAPDLPEGVYAVAVKGAANQPSVRVSELCTPELFTPEDSATGFIAGDVLIYFKQPMSEVELESFRVEYGLKTLIEHPLLGYYYAQLDPDLADDGVIEPFPSPVDCRANLRSSAVPRDIVLLVDLSGTMDLSYLRLVFTELTRQMYCLVNRESRVTLMGYNNEVEIVSPAAPWAEQSDVLLDWIQSPLRTRANSDLAQALGAALDYLSGRKRPDTEQQIMVLTRGPVSPRVENAQALIDRALASGVVIHGLGFANLFFRENQYDAIREIAQATGRDFLVFDEDNMRQAVAAARCTVVYGIHGQACGQQERPDDSSGTQPATCAIVRGVYGIDQCDGADALALIPRLPGQDPTAALIEKLNQDPRVDEAFFNDLLDQAQQDPNLGEQAWFEALGLPTGWAMFFPKKGAGVTMAVIDTGVDLGLTAETPGEIVLDEAAPQGLNFAPVPEDYEDKTGNDDLGHGTAVSAIAASVSDNGFNGAGVAPNATVIALKVFAVVEGQVKASNDSMAQAIMNAFVLGVGVVNISVGCQGCTEEQEARLRKFYGRVFDSLYAQFEHPPVVVAASGNDGANWIDAPASYEAVIAVGSVNPESAARSAFSNYGPQLDFVAVGENTHTTLPGGSFTSPGSGTSFSSPQVAGLAALILSERPDLNAQQVFERIQLCFVTDVDPPGYDEQTGWGQVRIPNSSAGVPPECLSR